MNNTIAALKGIPTKEELYELLLKEYVDVTFTKLNGDERAMFCTLRPEMIPESAKKPVNAENHFVVWDIRASGWRSFKYDRIKKVEQITPLGG